MSNVSVSFKLDSTENILQRRSLENGGKVQRYIDSEVLRLSDPYIPKDTGMLIDSGITHTVIGSGEANWNTPYAKKQYYNNNGHSGGKRGKLWFERMKVDHKEQILNGAARIAGGTVK